MGQSYSANNKNQIRDQAQPLSEENYNNMPDGQQQPNQYQQQNQHYSNAQPIKIGMELVDIPAQPANQGGKALQPGLLKQEWLPDQGEQPFQPNQEPSFLKDLSFRGAKCTMIVIALISFLQSAVNLGLFLYLGSAFAEDKNGLISPEMFPVSLIFLYVFATISTKDSSRKNFCSIMLTCALSFLTALTLMCFVSYFPVKPAGTEERLKEIYDETIYVFILAQLMSNTGSTLLIVIYVAVEWSVIRFSRVAILLIIPSIALLTSTFAFIVAIPITYLYSYALVSSLRRIQSGKYDLRTNQVIAAANIAFFEIIVPCQYG